MKATESHLDLRIDIFSLRQQRALVLPSLRPADLIAAILSEFRELLYLGDDPEQFELRGNGRPLDPAAPLGAQLGVGQQLALVEREQAPPAGTTRPATRLYLREPVSGKVYRVGWVPAVIGRSDPNLPHEDRLAANLGTFEDGPYVSRRHAQITEEGGQMLLASLGPNPTAVQAAGGATETVGAKPRPLRDGDLIMLTQSGIALKVIIREVEGQS